MSEPIRVDRRTTLKWVLAASAAMPFLRQSAFAAAAAASARGYGSDPNLTRIYKPGDLWPLTLTRAQRSAAAALCDTIIPADAESPGAASVGVVDFIDEWISAPYAEQVADRDMILAGLTWLDAEARRRFARDFAALEEPQRGAICDDICYAPKAKPQFAEAAKFFAKYRDLTAGGFYTTPAGTKDLRYVGNVPLERYDGPPPEVLRKIGLDEGAK
jgi:hypothetical protein